MPTSTAATSSRIVVSTSSRESMASDRYGLVWKKSNDATAASAVTMPAARPPSAATATTTIISTSAAFVVSNKGRNTAISAPAPIAAGTPTATPITIPALSTVGRRRSESLVMNDNQPTPPAGRKRLDALLTPHRRNMAPSIRPTRQAPGRLATRRLAQGSSVGVGVVASKTCCSKSAIASNASVQEFLGLVTAGARARARLVPKGAVPTAQPLEAVLLLLELGERELARGDLPGDLGEQLLAVGAQFLPVLGAGGTVGGAQAGVVVAAHADHSHHGRFTVASAAMDRTRSSTSMLASSSGSAHVPGDSCTAPARRSSRQTATRWRDGSLGTRSTATSQTTPPALLSVCNKCYRRAEEHARVVELVEGPGHLGRPAGSSWAVLLLLARRLPPGAAKELAGFLPNCVRLARRLRKDPSVPRRAKVAVGFAGFWVLSPIDLIPEFLPVIGPLDDVIVVALGASLRRQAGPPSDAARGLGRRTPHHRPTAGSTTARSARPAERHERAPLKRAPAAGRRGSRTSTASSRGLHAWGERQEPLHRRRAASLQRPVAGGSSRSTVEPELRLGAGRREHHRRRGVGPPSPARRHPSRRPRRRTALARASATRRAPDRHRALDHASVRDRRRSARLQVSEARRAIQQQSPDASLAEEAAGVGDQVAGEPTGRDVTGHHSGLAGPQR